MIFKFAIVALCVLFFSTTTSIQAQENSTPQPEQNYIRSWQQEIIFPSAIRFSVTLGLSPELINEVRLSIQPDTQQAVVIPMNLSETVVIGGEITVIDYIWTIPTDPPPLLFRDITMIWEAVSINGQAAQVTDRFTFIDERSSWLQDLEIDSNLFITLPNGEPITTTSTPNHVGINEFKNNLSQISRLLHTNLGTIPQFNLLIYSETLPICSPDTSGKQVAIGQKTSIKVTCNPISANAIFANSGYTIIQVGSTSLGTIESAISDFVVRQSYEQQWNSKTIPEWFKVGLTQFYSTSLKTELGAPLLNAARTNSLLPLERMATKPNDESNRELWLGESYGLVLYIASQVGVEGLFRLANNAATAATFEEAYTNTTGKSLNSLVDNFERWLFSDEALSAFAFTPYQVATPSRTPSRTPTTTRTFLPTNTSTPSLTPTVTGVLSLTPLPSRTATITPSPAPATNTPRPAGSLNTLTPTPAVTVLATSSANPSLILGLIILVIGAILVLITAIQLFRPKR